jgi:hypothetical protein
VSRLGTLSAAALKAMFSPDADDTLITLLTITGPGINGPIYLADNYVRRFEAASVDYALLNSATKTAIADDPDGLFYGVRSNDHDHIFLPFQITLPSEEHDAAPRCSLTINDVTRHLMPVLRTVTAPPSVLIQLVLASSPDVVEVSFPGFLMGGVSYTTDTISVELTVENLSVEPFPCHTFTPSYFPGMF